MRGNWVASVLVAALAPPILPASGLEIPCQVLEVSPPPAEKQVPRARFALLRHARPEDRPRLSAWLRSRSGQEVEFTDARGNNLKGALYRLNRCFGRGLLLFEGEAALAPGNILQMVLPDDPPIADGGKRKTK